MAIVVRDPKSGKVLNVSQDVPSSVVGKTVSKEQAQAISRGEFTETSSGGVAVKSSGGGTTVYSKEDPVTKADVEAQQQRAQVQQELLEKGQIQQKYVQTASNQFTAVIPKREFFKSDEGYSVKTTRESFVVQPVSSPTSKVDNINKLVLVSAYERGQKSTMSGGDVSKIDEDFISRVENIKSFQEKTSFKREQLKAGLQLFSKTVSPYIEKYDLGVSGNQIKSVFVSAGKEGFKSELARETILKPYDLSVGLGREAMSIGMKLSATVEGAIKSPSSTKEAYKQAGKEVFPALGKAYNPTTAEGLVNIATTVGAVYVLGTARKGSLEVSPKKGSVNVKSSSTLNKPRSTVVTEKGSFISKTGKPVDFVTKTTIKGNTGSYKITYKSGGKVISKSSGSIKTTDYFKSKTAFDKETVIEPSGSLKTVERIKGSIVTEKSSLSSKGLSFKQKVFSESRLLGKVKDKFSSVRKSDVLAKGSVKKTVETSRISREGNIYTNPKTTVTKTFITSKNKPVLETNIKSTIYRKPSFIKKVGGAVKKGYAEIGKPRPQIFSTDILGASTSELIGFGKGFYSGLKGTSSVFKTGSTTVSSITPSISGVSPAVSSSSLLLASSPPVPFIAPVSPIRPSLGSQNIYGNDLDSLFKTDFVTRNNVVTTEIVVTQPVVFSEVTSTSDTFSDTFSDTVTTPTTSSTTGSGGGFGGGTGIPLIILPKPSVFIGGGGGFSPKTKAKRGRQRKLYTPTLTSAILGLKRKGKSKIGVTTGLGLRGI